VFMRTVQQINVLKSVRHVTFPHDFVRMGSLCVVAVANVTST
jgi:hypothetical protein